MTRCAFSRYAWPMGRTMAFWCGVSVCVVLIFMMQPLSASATPDFGEPPSGQIPILYNDHTVYATPDTLVQGRVLAALVKDGQIFVPLRSMFEAMGAAVSVSSDGNTYTVTRDQTSASVTLNKAEIVVDGHTRPLDVPPMMYHGVVVVPVRVLSEALGAYVEWVPTRQLVVVRYIPPVPPSPAPTASPEPTAAPTAVPTPAPTPSSYTAFVQGALSLANNYNEYVAGKYCHAWQLSAVYAPLDSRFAGKIDYRDDTYVTSDSITDANGNQYTQFATIDGGTAFTPVFLGRQTSLDGRLEYRIAEPRIYVGVGYVFTSNNYGSPHWNGLGAGVEKLPDLRPGLRYYGSAFYYPSASGTYTASLGSNAGKTYQQQYQIWKLDIGLALVLRHSPLYLYGGFDADEYAAKKNAPTGQTHDGPYAGLGLKL